MSPAESPLLPSTESSSWPGPFAAGVWLWGGLCAAGVAARKSITDAQTIAAAPPQLTLRRPMTAVPGVFFCR